MEQISSEFSRNPSNVGRSSSSSKLHREESKKQLPSEEHQQTENPMSEEGKQFISGATHDEFGHSLEYPPDLPSHNFFYWKNLYPELEYMFDNLEVIREEANNIPQWVPWPEDHFTTQGEDLNTKDWTVFPMLHTFPAYDASKMTWVKSTCAHCPRTAEMLRALPNVRTALFSKLGPGTRLSSHTGWADLANHVLRVHFCLDVPSDGSCGLLVDGEIQYHKQGNIIVFDDSRPHRAFNLSDRWTRTVLIVDLLRPKHLPLGTATGSHTPELDDFVSLFK